MLKVKDLHVSYGPIHALKGISMEVHEGEIVTLIGSNGAGKSTTLSAITGLVKAQSGSVEFKGQNITNVPAYKIVTHGISLSPEGREVVPALTVQENLRLGAYIRKDKDGINASYERVYELCMSKLRNSPEYRAFYASLLGKLGDPRAIETLTSFLTLSDLTYLDYIEIANAIESLGGEVDTEREFTGDPYYESLKKMK